MSASGMRDRALKHLNSSLMVYMDQYERLITSLTSL